MSHRIEAWQKDGSTSFVEVQEDRIWMDYTEFTRLITADGWVFAEARDVEDIDD